MYISLLRTIGLKNTTFTANLPKYDRKLAVWQKEKLDIDILPLYFENDIATYISEFEFPNSSVFNTYKNMVLGYFRQGKSMDIFYIIDKALFHVKLIDKNSSHNKHLYQYLNFETEKEFLVDFMMQIAELNQLFLKTLDSAGNALISSSIAATGVILILASLFSLVPSIIGIGFVAGGAYAFINFLSQAEIHFNKIGDILENLKSKDKTYSDKNSYSFFSAAKSAVMRTENLIATQFTHDHKALDKIKASTEYLDKSDVKMLGI